MTHERFEAILTILILVCTVVVFVAHLVFAIIFSTTNWRVNVVGRNAMYLSLSLVILLGIVLLRQILGDYSWRLELTFVGIVWLAFVAVHRTYVLITIERASRQRRREKIEKIQQEREDRNEAL